MRASLNASPHPLFFLRFPFPRCVASASSRSTIARFSPAQFDAPESQRGNCTESNGRLPLKQQSPFPSVMTSAKRTTYASSLTEETSWLSVIPTSQHLSTPPTNFSAFFALKPKFRARRGKNALGF
jgi:hypothetical protein